MIKKKRKSRLSTKGFHSLHSSYYVLFFSPLSFDDPSTSLYTIKKKKRESQKPPSVMRTYIDTKEVYAQEQWRV